MKVAQKYLGFFYESKQLAILIVSSCFLNPAKLWLSKDKTCDTEGYMLHKK